MLLRLTQHDEGENRHRVEVRLEEAGAAGWAAESRFAFDLTAQDEEDVRWYLEDFLQYPQEPAPTIARRVEGRMSELGKELFQKVFESDRAVHHVVHFDGHGTYDEIRRLQHLLHRRPAPSSDLGGRRGFLAFENSDERENLELVDGAELGELLHTCRVPILVLNACRSAHNEAPEKPDALDGEGDYHSQVQAFGSLAQEVMEAGVGGVVAMSYNVWVVTAAQMVGELYASLARGRSLGEAVTLARKNLADRPLRAVAAEPRALQDWPVPVVYEAAPLRIFPEAREVEAPDFQVEREGTVGGGEKAAGSNFSQPIDGRMLWSTLTQPCAGSRLTASGRWSGSRRRRG